MLAHRIRGVVAMRLRAANAHPHRRLVETVQKTAGAAGPRRSEVTHNQEPLRALELSVADESRVPHSGWTLFTDLVVRGVLPHTALYDWPVEGEAVEPVQDHAVRTGRSERAASALVDLSRVLHGATWAYVLVHWGRLDAWIGSEDAALLDPARVWLRERFPEARPTGSTVPIVFWSLGSCGASQLTRSIAVPPWEDIESNYPRSVRTQLEPLLAGRPAADGGQLLLWHGAPGAGKTHVVRALAWEWREWCDIHYVTDPEEFFGRAGYMLEVLTDEPDDDERWRLLVLEDTGELLSADAKERTGQGLSRFLNVVDGILGQGLRLLVLVTTNELLRHLHPAVSRPGRCLAAVEFQAFGRVEAAAWLADRGIDGEPQEATLAELYALSDGRGLVAAADRRPIGF